MPPQIQRRTPHPVCVPDNNIMSKYYIVFILYLNTGCSIHGKDFPTPTLVVHAFHVLIDIQGAFSQLQMSNLKKIENVIIRSDDKTQHHFTLCEVLDVI